MVRGQAARRHSRRLRIERRLRPRRQAASHAVVTIFMRNRYILLADLCAIPIAACAAIALRFEWRFYTIPHTFWYVAAAVIIKPVILYWFGMYRRYWRYAS